MLKYDVPLALQVEIIGAALTAIFETLPAGHAARAALVERLEAKIKEAEFAPDRRHALERALADVTRADAGKEA